MILVAFFAVILLSNVKQHYVDSVKISYKKQLTGKSLIYLTESQVSTSTGTFELDGFLEFSNPSMGAKMRNRKMFYLIVCTDNNLREYSPLKTDKTSSNLAFCSAEIYYKTPPCTTIPLKYGYNLILGKFPSPGKYHFLLDNCESFGGADFYQRSCKQSKWTSSTCFKCLKKQSSNDDCEVAPKINAVLNIDIELNSCSTRLECSSSISYTYIWFYFGVAAMWVATSIMWLISMGMAGDVSGSLQKRLALVPIAQAMYMSFTVGIEYNSVVVMKHNLLTIPEMRLVVIMHTFATCTTIYVALLISKGFKITRQNLSKSENITIALVLFAWAFSSYLSGINGDARGVHIVLVLASYFTAVYLIFANCSKNICILRRQLTLIREIGIQPESTPVLVKLKLFQRFVRCLQAYFLLALFGRILISIFYKGSHASWLNVIVDESLDLCVCLAIGYTFRCRSFNNVLQVTYPVDGNSTQQQEVSYNNNGEQPLQPWTEGMQLPYVTDDTETGGAVVVVVNPGNERTELGVAASGANNFDVQPANETQSKK